MRLAFLKKKLDRLTKKLQKLDERCKAATDAAVVRSLTEELEELNEEITETRAEIAIEEAKDSDEQPPEERQNAPTGAERHNAGIVASYTQNGVQDVSRRSDGNPLDSMEYRTAFKNYFQRGVPIPADLRQKVDNYIASMPNELRAGNAVSTDDHGVIIPNTVMQQIINTVRTSYGNIYNKVRKISVPGGVEFPIGDLNADFHWITESTVSPEQEVGEIDAISFRYHIAELRIAQTFLSALLSIDAFENQLAQTVAKAYVKKMEIGIFRGTGVGQMTGILVDPRVINQVGHIISMTAADINNWKAWKTKFFAKIPAGYSVGDFAFAKSTVDTYLSTMADANNNPIFREAADLSITDGSTRGRFFGHELDVVEPDMIPDFDTASSGDIIGAYWQPEEYVINENYGFMTRRYYDETRNKWITKATTVVDGKPLNPTGFYLIAKA